MGLSDIIPGKEIYQDAFSPAMKQLGGMMESTMKVARFFAAPVEYAGAFQDRWQRYLKKIADKVPEANLVEGHPQIIVPSLEGLMLTTEGSLLSELFINLLAKSADKTQQEFAHPAFPNVIRQLSHDEAVILFLLKKNKYAISWEYNLVNGGIMIPVHFQVSEVFPVEKLDFPQNIQLYVNHLKSLNLLDENQDENYSLKALNETSQNIATRFKELKSLKLNDFGRLLAKASVPDTFENL